MNNNNSNQQRCLKLPPGKYNNWCERMPLVYKDRNEQQKAGKILYDSNLTIFEKSIIYVQKLVDCKGIEFVAIGNAHISKKTEIMAVHLVPCFEAELDGMQKNDKNVQRTLQMMNKSRFVYDGWIEFSNGDIEEIKSAIRRIDEVLAIFALQGRASLSWEPKYMPLGSQLQSNYHFEQKHIRDLKTFLSYLFNINEKDARAFFRSVGWLSQSCNLTDPVSRFLFSILAIESLVTYIESDSNNEACFKKLSKISSKKRKRQKKKCIQETIDEFYKADPIKTIENAYFNCILSISINKRLKTHLSKIFGENSEEYELLFKKNINGNSLYDFRNKVAHGSPDILNDQEREEIASHVWQAENIARLYLSKVMSQSLGKNFFEHQMTADQMILLQNFSYRKAEMYHGPIHMSQFYS